MNLSDFLKFRKHYFVMGLILFCAQNSLIGSGVEGVLKKARIEPVNKVDEAIELIRKREYADVKVLLEQASKDPSVFTSARAYIEFAKAHQAGSIKHYLGDPELNSALKTLSEKIDGLILTVKKLREFCRAMGKDLAQGALQAAEYRRCHPEAGDFIQVYKDLGATRFLPFMLSIQDAVLSASLSTAVEVVSVIGLSEATRIVGELTNQNELPEIRRLEDVGAGVKFLWGSPEWNKSSPEEMRLCFERAFRSNYEEAAKLMWIYRRYAVEADKIEDLLRSTVTFFQDACIAKNVNLVRFFLLSVAGCLNVQLNLDQEEKNERSWWPSLFSRSKEEVHPSYANFLDASFERVEMGYVVRGNPLEMALTYNDTQMAELLVLARANLKTALELWAMKYKDLLEFQRWNVLHLASWLDSPLVVKIALNAQTASREPAGGMVACWDRSSQDARGRTAFHIAAMMGSARVADVLFDPKQPQLAYVVDKDGVTALGLSVLREVEERKNLLVRNMLDFASEEVKGEEKAIRGALLKALLDIDDSNKSAVDGSMVSAETQTKRRKPLHIAAQMGNEAAVRLMVTKSWLLDEPRNLLQERDGYGRMPIHYAVESGNLGMVNLLALIDGSANFHRDRSGSTPLHLAAEKKKKEVFDRLVELSSIDDLCYETCDGKTVLHLAIESKFDDASIIGVFKKYSLLCDKPDSEGRTPLYLAVLYSNKVLVEYLLGVNPKSAERKEKIKVAAFTKGHGDTVLHLTARLGNEEISKLLIAAAHETDLYFKDRTGKAPIHHAVESNKENVVALLQDKSPGSIWVIDDKKETPLHKSARLGYSKVATQLLDINFMRKAAEKLATTFFITNTAIERLINEQNFEGQTALHVAVQRCEEVIHKRDQEGDDAFKLLGVLCSNSKVDKSITDKYQKKAEEYAQRTDVVLLLGGYKDTDNALNTMSEAATGTVETVTGTAKQMVKSAQTAIESIPGKAINKAT